MKILSLVIISLSTLLSACSSAPPQVEASISLINTDKLSKKQQLVPQELWQDLHERLNGEAITYKQVNIVFGDKYLSALGVTCRKVFLKKQSNEQVTIKAQAQQRISCLANDNKSWVLTPDVIDHKNELIRLGSS